MENSHNDIANGMPTAQLYLPGIRLPSLLPSAMVPVLAMADPASTNNFGLQNFMPAGLGPAEYLSYLNRLTNGSIGTMGNQDGAMHQPHQPNPQELAEFAYAYHQMNQVNRHPGGDKSFS
jgi:hypothetical protein